MGFTLATRSVAVVYKVSLAAVENRIWNALNAV